MKSIGSNLFKRLSRNDMSILSQKSNVIIFRPNLKRKVIGFEEVTIAK